MLYFKNILSIIAVAILVPANIFAQKFDSGLLKAAKDGIAYRVEWALNAGTSVDVTDKKGRTPLMLAAEKGRIDVVRLLVEKGANIDLVDKKGESALAKARKKKKTAVIHLLDFEAAKKVNTIESFEAYLQNYPGSDFTHLANDYLNFLEAEKDGTLSAFASFIENYPENRMVRLARSRIDSLQKIRFGCDYETGRLSAAAMQELATITQMIAKHEDVKMLAFLYDFIKKDSTNNIQARSYIQNILSSISNQQDINFDETYAQKANKLLDVFTFGKTMYPKFSYESVLCREIMFMQLREKMKKLPSKLDVGMAMLNGRMSTEQAMQAYQLIKYAPKLVTAPFVRAMKDLVEKPMDACARYRTWEFAERLVSGHVYYNSGGLEISDDAVEALNVGFERETHPEIKAFAAKILGEINKLRDEVATKRVESLLKSYGSVTAIDSSNNSTALIKSIEDDFSPTVELLLEMGADVKAKNYFGHSSLYLASVNGYNQIVKLLLDNNADIESESSGGVSPLLIASSRGHVEVVEILLKYGADVNHCNKNGYSPLIAASNGGHTEVVKLLLNYQPDLSHKDKDGVTAFKAATDKNHAEIIQLLKQPVAKK